MTCPSQPIIASLPLMGIENPAAGRLRPRRRRLITPHGDRKPVPRFHPDRVRLLLITPHGDRKREPLTPADKPTVKLITPHGDRKRGRPGAPASRAAPPHYPSWGSKTRAISRAPTLHGLSLPLMGIENAYRRRCADRSTTAHYPSWGSKTVRGWRAHARRPGSHYPSWGSKTRYLSVLQSHGRCAIPIKICGTSTGKCAGRGCLRWSCAQAHMPSVRVWTSPCHATRLRPGASVLRERPCRVV